MVGVISKIKFVHNESLKFKNYINYINRNEACKKRNFYKYSSFNDYMANPEKVGNLFTKDKHSLSEKDIKKLKVDFNKAQENGSHMWQKLFSFDNLWLEKQGLYDDKNKSLDEEKIQEATRAAMNKLCEKEKIKELTWTASLHYNTDNIHVHIASVEINPSRDRGKFKPKTLVHMKNSFVNSLLEKQKDLKKINFLIRDNLIYGKRNISFKEDLEMRKIVKEIIKKLPKDKGQWHYNYNTMQEVKPLIDNLTTYYIEKYKKNEFKELVEMLEKQENFYKEVYGVKEKKSSNYKDTKIQDLYIRMGNSLLKEIKNHIKDEESKKAKNFNNLRKDFENRRNIIIANKNIQAIKNSFNEDIETIKNLKEYEKLQNEIEYSMNM